MSLFHETIYTLISRFGVLILAMGSSALIARVLGPEQNGSYTIAILWITTLVLIFNSGLGLSIVYFGAQQPLEIPSLLGMAIVSAVVLGLLGIVLTWLLAGLPIVSNYLTSNGISVDWIRLFVLVIPFIHLNSFCAEILRGGGKIKLYARVSVIQQLFLFTVLGLLVATTSISISLTLVAYGVAQILLSLVVFAMAFNTAGQRIRWDMEVIIKSYKFGLRFHPSAIAQYLNYRLDVFLVGWFLPPAQAGFYALATLLAERIWEIPSALQRVMLYRVASESSRAPEITNQVIRSVLLLMMIICLVIAFVSPTLITLIYGTSYTPIVAAFIFLLPGIWSLSAGKILAAYVAGTGQADIATLAVAGSLFVTIVFDIGLIPQLGIVGAAVASSLSYSTFTGLLLYFYLKRTGHSLREVLFIRASDLYLLQKQLLEFARIIRK